MGIYPNLQKKQELINMISDESLKERISNIPEMVYGENATPYELQILSTLISSNMSYNYSISYHGIRKEKIDTLFYVGPSLDLEEVVSRVEEELKDVDY